MKEEEQEEERDRIIMVFLLKKVLVPTEKEQKLLKYKYFIDKVK